MGLATARLLASRGALISLADLNEGGLKEAQATLASSDKHLSVSVDVRDSQSVNSWIEQTVKKFGKLDGAVNMAGVIVPTTPVKDMKDSDWDFMFSVNTRGVFNCIRAQLNAMTDGASIVSVPSSGTFHPLKSQIHTLIALLGLCSQCIWPVRSTRKLRVSATNSNTQPTIYSYFKNYSNSRCA